MTAPTERPADRQDEAPPQDTGVERLAGPGEPQTTVDQLRDAGFSEAHQTVLTTAFLRVLALWTQQATRGDVQGAQQAIKQCMTQQCAMLREAIGQALAQHGTRIREEFAWRPRPTDRCLARDAAQDALTRQAALLPPREGQPPRTRDVPRWVRTVLLGLTCTGVLLLVGLHLWGR